MNVCFCDGGLSNRLNSLLFSLMLTQRFESPWQVSWPCNNWCGATLDSLFSVPLGVVERDLDYYRRHPEDYTFLLHENQGGFPSDRVIMNASLGSFEAYGAVIGRVPQVFYMHSLIPHFVTVQDVCKALTALRVNSVVLERATEFCNGRQINDAVLGLHIRKTDFGETVKDGELFELVNSSSKRFFVCSDDAAVNERFSTLPNCSVFEKSHFPVKQIPNASWQEWITDAAGRRFPFNIDRSGESIVEALVDLLILSRTTLVQTSHSTFLRMAMMFKACNFF